MNKAQLGRIILTATSPDTNVRLTHEEGNMLACEYLNLADKARAFDQLRECMGYVQNSSDQHVGLSQDDATHTFFVVCGDKVVRTYFDDSLQGAIAKAYEKEKQE